MQKFDLQQATDLNVTVSVGVSPAGQFVVEVGNSQLVFSQEQSVLISHKVIEAEKKRLAERLIYEKKRQRDEDRLERQRIKKLSKKPKPQPAKPPTSSCGYPSKLKGAK